MILEPSFACSLKGKQLTFTDGVFDLLHPGHIAFLESIKEDGRETLVCVLSDEWVKARKGANRPILSGVERARIVDSLKCVTYTIHALDPETNARIPITHLLKSIQPSLFVTTDAIWASREHELSNWGITLRIVPRANVGNISTTEIIRKIRESQC